MRNQSKIKRINNVLVKKNKNIFWLFAFSILLFIVNNFYFVYIESTLSFKIENLDKQLAELTSKKSNIEISYIADVDKINNQNNNFDYNNTTETEYISSTGSTFAYNK